MASKLALSMIKGTTFPLKLRWATPVKSYAPIQSISNGAPAEVVTSSNHGIPDNWEVWVESAGGMTDINTTPNTTPEPSKKFRASVVDVSTVELVNKNTLGLPTHVAGTGVLVWYTPEDLTDVFVKMELVDDETGETVDTFTSDDARKTAGTGFWVNNTDKTITLEVADTVTEAYTFVKAKFSVQVTIAGATPKTRVLARGGIRLVVDETSL